MIKHPDIDQRQRLPKLTRQMFVGRRRLGNAGGVIVRQNNSGGIMPERPLHYLTRIDAGLRLIDKNGIDVVLADLRARGEI